MDYKIRNINRPLAESVRLFHSLYNVQVDVPYDRCIAKYLHPWRQFEFIPTLHAQRRSTDLSIRERIAGFRISKYLCLGQLGQTVTSTLKSHACSSLPRLLRTPKYLYPPTFTLYVGAGYLFRYLRMELVLVLSSGQPDTSLNAFRVRLSTGSQFSLPLPAFNIHP